MSSNVKNIAQELIHYLSLYLALVLFPWVQSGMPLDLSESQFPQLKGQDCARCLL